MKPSDCTGLRRRPGAQGLGDARPPVGLLRCRVDENPAPSSRVLTELPLHAPQKSLGEVKGPPLSQAQLQSPRPVLRPLPPSSPAQLLSPSFELCSCIPLASLCDRKPVEKLRLQPHLPPSPGVGGERDFPFNSRCLQNRLVGKIQ